MRSIDESAEIGDRWRTRARTRERDQDAGESAGDEANEEFHGRTRLDDEIDDIDDDDDASVEWVGGWCDDARVGRRARTGQGGILRRVVYGFAESARGGRHSDPRRDEWCAIQGERGDGSRFERFTITLGRGRDQGAMGRVEKSTRED